jgi:hypothetical protein
MRLYPRCWAGLRGAVATGGSARRARRRRRRVGRVSWVRCRCARCARCGVWSVGGRARGRSWRRRHRGVGAAGARRVPSHPVGSSGGRAVAVVITSSRSKRAARPGSRRRESGRDKRSRSRLSSLGGLAGGLAWARVWSRGRVRIMRRRGAVGLCGCGAGGEVGTDSTVGEFRVFPDFLGEGVERGFRFRRRIRRRTPARGSWSVYSP